MPENAEQAQAQVASRGFQDAAGEPAPENQTLDNQTQESPSGNAAAAPPQQRQRAATSEGDPNAVGLQVGAPEHARGAVRGQADRQQVIGHAYGFSPGVGPPVVVDGATRHVPSGSVGGPWDPSVGNQSVDHGAGADFAPSTVRVGGYTPPERVSPAVGEPAPSGHARSVRVPRRTSLQLQRLDPWSVLKLSLVLSVAGFLVWMVAVGVLYGVLAGMGVWDQVNGTYSDLTSANNAQMSTDLISGGRVFGVAMVIGLVNIVLMTALATVGSLIYNVAADLVGGVEVTLSEPE
jgi:Transmembrane domain of unknown function (DUF3566)